MYVKMKPRRVRQCAKRKNKQMNLKKEYLRPKAVAETSLNAVFKRVAENKITGKAKYLINDDNRLGIVVGKWEIYCHKKR